MGRERIVTGREGGREEVLIRREGAREGRWESHRERDRGGGGVGRSLHLFVFSPGFVLH